MKEKGWEVLKDPAQLKGVVQQVLTANSELVERYRGGEEKLWGFFVGQVMRTVQGKADPQMVNELLKGELTQKS